MKPLWIRLWAIFFFGLAVCAAPGVQARVVEGGHIMDQHMRENLCALTFDDGPSANTPQLLDMLNEYGIPATFFLLGKQAERHPDLVRRILAEGHEVGNHSYSHPNLRMVSFEKKMQEIGQTDAILRSLGASPAFLRPPYGAYDNHTVAVAEKLGLGIMLWSLDSRDWKSLPADYATLRSTRGTVYNTGSLRGIFLFHDTHKRTVEDLPRVIRDLRAGGCQRFVTVSDYLDGLLDPEPGVLMTRRPADNTPSMVAGKKPGRLKEQFQEMPPESYPAGTAALPLARTSRPWQAESSAAEAGSQPGVEANRQGADESNGLSHERGAQPAAGASETGTGMPLGSSVAVPGAAVASASARAFAA